MTEQERRARIQELKIERASLTVKHNMLCLCADANPAYFGPRERECFEQFLSVHDALERLCRTPASEG